jgi:hypothetical protein
MEPPCLPCTDMDVDCIPRDAQRQRVRSPLLKAS